jgi:hypothetical protein
VRQDRLAHAAAAAARRARALPIALAVLALAMLSGCGGLRLALVRASHERPSNVAVYFRVESDRGEPVGGLEAGNFRIYEDGTLVSQYESKQTIVNPRVAASHYTLLLVDMSGSVSGSGGSQALVDAASAFTTYVEKFQKVGVYAFDGSEHLHPVAPFTGSAGGALAGIKTLAQFKPRDPSTNLNGAVVKALQQLATALEHAENPLRFGTLVVFTDGTDRAGRVSTEQMRRAVRESPYEVFAIGLGAELKEPELRELGRNGTAMAADRTKVIEAFDTIARSVEATTRRYYLLSYCSPSRAGEHEVRIEAVAPGEDGKGERKGSLTARFDATGFGPGCDPNRPPRFDVSRGDAIAVKDTAREREAERGKGAGKEPREHKKGDAKKPGQPVQPPANPAAVGKPKPAPASPEPPPVKPGDDFNP